MVDDTIALRLLSHSNGIYTYQSEPVDSGESFQLTLKPGEAPTEIYLTHTHEPEDTSDEDALSDLLDLEDNDGNP